MRLLLNHVRGAGKDGDDAQGKPLGYDDLKTDLDGNVCATYQEAAQRLGLLVDDKEWDE